MTVPKFVRRWVYKRILKEINRRHRTYNTFFDTYLCTFCRFQFPYINIKHYPELWDRRTSLKRYDETRDWGVHVWFLHDGERKVYIEEALDLINKTK